MALLSQTTPSGWPYRYYSYAAVLGMAGLGLGFPALAGRLLGPPLAMGMVLLGVAHGACDHLVMPAGGRMATGWRYWLWFLVGYLGLAGAVGLLWWRWPAPAVGLFLVLTVWHWGSADAPALCQGQPGLWLVHSVLRGLLIFAVPAWWWPAQTASVINGLLTFTGGQPVLAATFAAGAAGLGLLTLVGHLALWGWHARQQHGAALRTDILETLLLAGLFVALPPRLSVAVYFVFWHSLQHVLRLTSWLGYAVGQQRGRPASPALLPRLAFFLKRAAPLLLLSCVALLVLGRLAATRLPDSEAWFSLALVVASVVTLPHAVLVSTIMDAPFWRGLSRRPPGQRGLRASSPAVPL
ncbi:Brp/Blh family beta-carotene 15,15'-dioxygenase [Hymenobacter sp. H14-R3]|uniref:Brp/Blh family beta-carotene 15,15'-dioxygenase n=1 Tax=Hymenobacter sp. H14-R3 TaxID=3046308 RepID=UPI0024BAE187|nr:Brp/Blh family beta-carotene 15,15'-dioxygenase [Hymenobacter sp. H14-R3]MDJ0366565.1 Brp/Blh family beta-carotene 15,15'-dioxygenase [Hymenobacter sp. H14-R3]